MIYFIIGLWVLIGFLLYIILIDTKREDLIKVLIMYFIGLIAGFYITLDLFIK